MWLSHCIASTGTCMVYFLYIEHFWAREMLPVVSPYLQQYANLEAELDSLIAYVSLEHVTQFVSLATRITRWIHEYCHWGYKAKSFNHIHSPEALIQFLFNALRARSHSNSIPYNWDSIQINSSQLCHSISILHNSIPFHLKQFLIPVIHILHILVFTT